MLLLAQLCLSFVRPLAPLHAISVRPPVGHVLRCSQALDGQSSSRGSGSSGRGAAAPVSDVDSLSLGQSHTRVVKKTGRVSSDPISSRPRPGPSFNSVFASLYSPARYTEILPAPRRVVMCSETPTRQTSHHVRARGDRRGCARQGLAARASASGHARACLRRRRSPRAARGHTHSCCSHS